MSVHMAFYVMALTPTVAALGIVSLIACVTLSVIARRHGRG